MSSSVPNIWYVAHYAGGPGIGRHSRGWYLARTWVKHGARATVIAANRHHMLDASQPSGPQQVEGVDYHFLPAPAYSTNGLMRVLNMFAFTAAFWASQRQLISLHGRPDVIIASSPHPFSFIATHRLARLLGARSIFEVRDLWPASITEIMNVSNRHPMIRLTAAVERFGYFHADAVVSLLPRTEEYMRSRGLTGDRWHYIPNGIVRDEPSDRPPGSPIFALIDEWRSKGLCIVSYTGALGVPNNVDRLIDAMALLKTRNPSVRALIVGRGDVEEQLKAMVASLGLSEQVRFFGQMPKSVARAILKHVDIGFIGLKPSPVFRFGISPNKIFDYMVSGLPIVSAIEAGNDIVAEAGCGISVPGAGPSEVAQALDRLACMTPAERDVLGSKGKCFVESKHDYELLGRTYLKITGWG
ncbi:glycosyltransferase family 4 protein [Rhizobium sp. AQ_MP]|uniref:glycosyltransferase family 4 protein n=1 Tax=Rhizobium sp. AQ_MP TaxID=2761536 RepID=UPI00163ADF78|nr:glycosyltransferase family 4 protein [Rhizobium sp. AQ_MP]MBC2775761.1 glycosyltransferase family 4 protein [Rhizobium sp. AQ_MP]